MNIIQNDSSAAAAAAGKRAIEAVHEAVVAFLQRAEQQDMVTIPESGWTQFYRGLHYALVSADSDWRRMFKDTAPSNGTSSSRVESLLQQGQIKTIPEVVRKFIDAQIAAGNIQVSPATRNQFFTSLAAASQTSLGSSPRGLGS